MQIGEGHPVTEPRTYPGTPGWVKIVGIAFAVLVLVFVVMAITGLGGEHGPGRHGLPQADTGPEAGSSLMTDNPDGGHMIEGHGQP